MSPCGGIIRLGVDRYAIKRKSPHEAGFSEGLDLAWQPNPS